MNRLSQGVIASGFVAMIAGWMMKRNSRNHMMNKAMNMMINVMGSLGIFRIMSKTKYFRKMVNLR